MKVFLLACIGLTGLFAADAQTSTSSITRETTFPPIGLGSTQTARINVFNVASNSSSGTAASCTGSVSFLNAAGTVIGSATTFTVTAGQTFTVALPFASSGGTAPHTVIRAVVQLTLPIASPRPPCSLESTFELDDTSTGAVQVFLGSGGALGFPAR